MYTFDIPQDFFWYRESRRFNTTTNYTNTISTSATSVGVVFSYGNDLNKKEFFNGNGYSTFKQNHNVQSIYDVFFYEQSFRYGVTVHLTGIDPICVHRDFVGFCNNSVKRRLRNKHDAKVNSVIMQIKDSTLLINEEHRDIVVKGRLKPLYKEALKKCKYVLFITSEQFYKLNYRKLPKFKFKTLREQKMAVHFIGEAFLSDENYWKQNLFGDYRPEYGPLTVNEYRRLNPNYIYVPSNQNINTSVI